METKIDNNNLKKNLAFYEPPPRKTSAEIINEARLAIKGKQISNEKRFVRKTMAFEDTKMCENTPTTIKPLQTQRPFTPRDKERLLFGKRNKTNRPPSSFRYIFGKKEF